jgi:hypothetical protein
VCVRIHGCVRAVCARACVRACPRLAVRVHGWVSCPGVLHANREEWCPSELHAVGWVVLPPTSRTPPLSLVGGPNVPVCLSCVHHPLCALCPRARYDECVSKLTPFLKSSGYNVAKHVSWVPISALTGVNVLVSAWLRRQSPRYPWGHLRLSNPTQAEPDSQRTRAPARVSL